MTSPSEGSSARSGGSSLTGRGSSDARTAQGGAGQHGRHPIRSSAMPYAHTLALTLAIASGSAHAMSDAALADIVGQRLTGDRTGACMAVAVIENGTFARTFQCADGKDAARIGS